MKITKKQKQNAFHILNALNESGINSSSIWIGILCVIGKESGFVTRVEKSYRRTSNARIRKIFGRRKLGKFYDDDAALTGLKKRDVDFFSRVYGKLGGNKAKGDGFRYRGRGFNQLTFLGNYRRYSYGDVDLVRHPGRLRDPEVAAKVSVMFFEQQLGLHRSRIYDRFGVNVGNVGSSDTGVMIAANINAGMGKKTMSASVQRAYRHAIEYHGAAIDLYNDWWYSANVC